MPTLIRLRLVSDTAHRVAATDVTDTPADTEAEAKEKEDKAKADADEIAGTGTMPEDGQIYISEVMFAGGGSLPQWIEISNGSRTRRGEPERLDADCG